MGRLDAVKTFFHSDGSLKPASLKPGANRKQLQRGFLWACASGCDGVVAFLLDHGAELSERADTGQTGLHWAVVGGNLSTIKLLIERGAPLEERNAYGGTALGQALWSFIHGDPEIDYASIVEMLLAARAKIETGLLGQLEKDWLEKEWLQEGKVRAASAKNRILEALRRYGATTEGNYD